MTTLSTQPAATLRGPSPTSGAVVPRHTPVEDLAGLLTGSFLASLGLHVLDAGGVITGGTAGLALLLAHVTALGFGPLFFLLSLPFVALALRRKGRRFTLRSGLALAAVAAFSLVHPLAAPLEDVDQVYAALAGNLAAGVGILIVFRHGASLGGFNVIALLCQERRGWRAGYVQLALDTAVVAAFLAVGDGSQVLLSAAGAVVLNLVLAMNHRPGRYLA